MFKTLFFVLLCMFQLPVSAKVEVRWMSVASFVLQDEKTTIFFDPMFTRSGFFHWMNFSKLRSNEERVKSILKTHDLMKVDAVFASHSHYDHVIDAPMVAKYTNAVFYVDESSEKIAKAYKDPSIRTLKIENSKKIIVGDFTITPVRREHSPIRTIDFHFLPGPVRDDFDFGFYDYRVGDTWLYVIEHPQGNILIDQGSEANLKEVKPYISKVSAIIQGIANRESDDSIMNGYLEHLKPDIFIPSHFDNFFFELDTKAEVSYLPGVNFKRLIDKLSQSETGFKVIVPKFGEKIVIIE